MKNYLLQSLPGSVPAVRHSVEFRGKVFGRVIEGTVTRAPADKPKLNSLLSQTNNSQDFIMVVDESGEKIDVIENAKSKNPSFYIIAKPTVLLH